MLESLKDLGIKFDQDKTRYDLFPVDALEEVGRVYTFGANKYADHNWRKGMSWSRIFAATMRHLWAFWRGEDNDPETGLSHAAHAAFGCLALIQYSKEKAGTDDRYKAASLDNTDTGRTHEWRGFRDGSGRRFGGSMGDGEENNLRGPLLQRPGETIPHTAPRNTTGVISIPDRHDVNEHYAEPPDGWDESRDWGSDAREA